MNPTPTLRHSLRAARRALSPHQQRLHALSLARLLGQDLRVLRARRIGGYWSSDGELDIDPLARRLIARGGTLFLPVIRPLAPGLWFVRRRGMERMRPNRFGIPEPRARGRSIQLAWNLDLLLVPLVGFDADCNRMGMGGGYYDRTLAYLRRRRHWRRPRLIGVAHECQRLERIAARPWDIPLDAVVTEARWYRRGGVPVPIGPRFGGG